jgi:BolA protein
MTDTLFIDQMRHKLATALAPTRLDITDESARHAGHAGARPGGNSHFRVTVVSAAFVGLSRVERHRLIYQILADDLQGQLHALAIQAQTPQE